jgi:hypothetical protein
MRIHGVRTILTVAAMMGASLLITPLAAQADGTTVTFAITGGALNITTPASVNLGSGLSGGTLSGQLGAVQVTDARSSLIATWTATVSSTAFTTGGATPAETIPLSAVSYWSGPATATTGLSLALPGQLTSVLATGLTTPRIAFALAAGVGNNSSTWNPTLVIAVPSTAVTGTYTGTVTHSVA